MEWLHVALVSCCFVLLSSAEVVKVEIQNLPLQNATTSRIVGGTPTNIERYPFAVQLIYMNGLACGGSLITARHVLTAAHCFYDSRGVLLSITQFTVRAGTPLLNTGGVTRRASTLIIHERYNTPLRDNDIAIMVLSQSYTFSSTIGRATLPLLNAQLNDNTPVWHIGWGVLFSGSQTASPVLNEAQVYTINNTICRTRYQQLEVLQNQAPGYYGVTNNKLCSGLLDIGGKDACQGDSGSPLVYAGHYVVGVTAWGAGCGDPRYPGVNMRTSAYTDWIDRTVARFNASPDTKASAVLLLTLLFTVIYTNKLV